VRWSPDSHISRKAEAHARLLLFEQRHKVVALGVEGREA
jgi:hypothetical protein